MNLDLREIPAVYMNLEQHTEKNENMQSILKECGFKTIIRVEGVPRPDRPVAGCSAAHHKGLLEICLLYTSPSPRDRQKSRMPSSA